MFSLVFKQCTSSCWAFMSVNHLIYQKFRLLGISGPLSNTQELANTRSHFDLISCILPSTDEAIKNSRSSELGVSSCSSSSRWLIAQSAFREVALRIQSCHGATPRRRNGLGKTNDKEYEMNTQISFQK